MNRSLIPSVLRQVHLNENDVVAIYNYGSWAYGTNSETSDRDLMIVTRNYKQDPLVFQNDFDYYHNFELHKLGNDYDVCIHSIENFEILLEKNYLVAVECVFLPEEFKLKEKIDLKRIYLEKYYNQKRIELGALYENAMSLTIYENDEIELAPRRSSFENGDLSTKNYLFKQLFHGLRFLDVAEQLIRTRSIEDFRRVMHVFNRMKELRGDPTVDENISLVLEYWKEESKKLKKQLEQLFPIKVVKGIFEAHVTFECSNNTEKTIEDLKTTCENSKFKLIFIELDSREKRIKLHQLMTSSYHTGQYPDIVGQIEAEVYDRFKKFNIIRVKIESLASNEGVPTSDVEKKLLWGIESTYFEFHYRVLVQKRGKSDPIKDLKEVCRRFYGAHLHLSNNAFKNVDETDSHYLITMRLFDVGRENAFLQNDNVIQHLTSNEFPPLKVVREFIVHDNHIELDNDWN